MRVILSSLFICCVVGCIPEEPTGGDDTDTSSADAALASPEETAADPNETGLTPRGIATGDWSTFPMICNGCGKSGNLVRLWQSVLWADNAGGKFSSATSIDGDFGPMTTSATVSWQNTSLPSDHGSGQVGPHTWGTAQSLRLKVELEGLCKGGVVRFTYHGSAGRNFSLTENCSTSAWLFINPRTGLPTDTSYN
jgi:hypothetical protein